VALPPAARARFPRLEERLRLAELGAYPTPVEPLDPLARELGRGEGELYAKRDDRSSLVYGGNKVRTLEVLFGEALAIGAPRVIATGAYGSNHALATVLHAPRVGLSPGVALFPQPATKASVLGLAWTLANTTNIVDVFHWATLPFRIARLGLRARRPDERALVMMPGGATPLGALGYVLAAFELAAQVRAGELPAPRRIYVGVGSNATTAGLLLGLVLASKAGIGFTRPPEVVAVRVTPWPVTSRLRILGLAERTARLLADRSGDRTAVVTPREIAPFLEVTGRYLGRGYARPTPEGLAAIDLFQKLGLFELDTTYSAKAVSAFIDAARDKHVEGPLLYWSTRSTAALPPVRPEQFSHAPERMKRWLKKAFGELGIR
jgi:D-cysteine desulfhydrase